MSNDIDFYKLNKLIELLEKSFPNKLPYEEISSYELGVLIGQQDIINFLKAKYEIGE